LEILKSQQNFKIPVYLWNEKLADENTNVHSATLCDSSIRTQFDDISPHKTPLLFKRKCFKWKEKGING
jgi:hypothetical protein